MRPPQPVLKKAFAPTHENNFPGPWSAVSSQTHNGSTKNTYVAKVLENNSHNFKARKVNWLAKILTTASRRQGHKTKKNSITTIRLQ